jgi:hypothetical protein
LEGETKIVGEDVALVVGGELHQMSGQCIDGGLGRGTTRPEDGVLSRWRSRVRGWIRSVIMTSRRKKSISESRRASSSPMRNPVDTWKITIACMRAGIASTSART